MTAFILSNEKGIYLSHNQSINLYDAKLKLLESFETDYGIHKSRELDSGIYFENARNEALIIDYDLNLQKSMPAVNPIEKMGRGGILVCSMEESGKLRLVNVLTSQVKWEISFKVGKHIASIKNFLCVTVGRKNNELTCIERDNGKVAWNYKLIDNLSNEGGKTKFQAIVGFIGTELWLALSNGQVLVLDVTTGRKICLLGSAEPKAGVNPDAFPVNRLKLDLPSGKVIGAVHHYLWVIDVETKEWQFHDLRAVLAENKIEFNKDFVVDEDHIYFIDNYHDKVGALNRKTLQLEGEYAFAAEAGQPVSPMDIQQDDSRLFVLDTKNTLHIFEKPKQAGAF